MSNEQGKWKDILVSKCSMESNLRQLPVKFQSRWWRDLSKTCGEGEESGWFQAALHWKVGSGDKVRF